MVVVSSRKEAVRWKLAIDKFIKDKGYAIGTLVAFSGKVSDPESGPEDFSETSTLLNPTLAGREVGKAFKEGDYRVMLAANKFQTGFDVPKLCGMYVDKRLAGIQAVQTLSRLNRAHPGKDTTYVVDFVNDPAEVLEEFKKYYTTAELAGTSDPNLVYDLRAKLDAAGYYEDHEIERLVKVELDPNAKQSELVAAMLPVADRIKKTYDLARKAFAAANDQGDTSAAEKAKGTVDAIVLFHRDMGAYLRLYTFLSQIFDFGSTDIEKRAMFYRRLLPLLELERERQEIDISKLKLTSHALRDRGKAAMGLTQGPTPKLYPITEAGGAQVREKDKVRFGELVEKVNSLFEGDLTDQDKLVYVNDVLFGKLLESQVLIDQATNNTREQFAVSPDLDRELLNAIMGALDAQTTMSTQALNSADVRTGLKQVLLDYARLWEALRAKSAGAS
jgi:type I restriction enzyme R subunit